MRIECRVNGVRFALFYLDPPFFVLFAMREEAVGFSEKVDSLCSFMHDVIYFGMQDWIKS